MSLSFLSSCPWSSSSPSEAISWWFPWWSSSSSLYTYKHIFKYLFLLCLNTNHNVLYILFHILLFSLGNRSWSFSYISLDRAFLFSILFVFFWLAGLYFILCLNPIWFDVQPFAVTNDALINLGYMSFLL